MGRALWLAWLVGCGPCRGVQASPPIAPAEEAIPEPTEPELMADFAVPAHPDLRLGAHDVAAVAVDAYLPRPAPGRSAIHRVWASARDRDWRAVEVQLWRDTSTEGRHEREQLRASGEALEAFSALRLGAAGPAWGVVASRPSGAPEFRELPAPELLIATTGTAFQSPWSGQAVTIEVQGRQPVTVPAGTFDALRVRRTWAHRDRSTEEVTWWTAEHGAVAQVLRVQTHGDPEARLTVLADERSGAADGELLETLGAAREAVGLTR